MKTFGLFTTVLFLMNAVAFAAPAPITSKDVASSYIVGKLALESYYAFELKVAADGKRVTFRDGNMDHVRPSGDCAGTLDIVQALAVARVNCKSLSGKELRFEIDLTNISAQQLKKGTVLKIRSDATQMQWLPFNTIQRQTPFFP